MSVYREYWDRYVRDFASDPGDASAWPGDEWGAASGGEEWKELFARLFESQGVGKWRHALEIGSGAGKYTAMVLARNPDLEVHACDVSSRFLGVLETRLAAEKAAGRLKPVHLEAEAADEMLRVVEKAGLARKLDAVFSIDAMVHVDLQYLVDYLLTAGLVLRPGGRLILTLPDATSDAGFFHLIRGIRDYYHLQGKPSGKFEWLDETLVRRTLERLGFEVETLEPWPPGRDIVVVARLERPHVADLLRWALEGDVSTTASLPADADPPLLMWESTFGVPCRLEVSADDFATVAYATSELRHPYFRLPEEFWSRAAPGTPYSWRVVRTDDPDSPVVGRGRLVRSPSPDPTP